MPVIDAACENTCKFRLPCLPSGTDCSCHIRRKLASRLLHSLWGSVIRSILAQTPDLLDHLADMTAIYAPEDKQRQWASSPANRRCAQAWANKSMWLASCQRWSAKKPVHCFASFVSIPVRGGCRARVHCLDRLSSLSPSLHYDTGGAAPFIELLWMPLPILLCLNQLRL